MPTEVSKDKYLNFLWKTGNFWNPDNPDTHNVTQDDLKNLTLDHKLVQQATQSWQLIDANFDALSLIFHLRKIIADGDVGPATEAMVEVNRCPIPDYAPPPGVELGIDDPELAAAVESMRAFAQGSGSWIACDPTQSGLPHSIRVRIDPNRMPSGVADYHKKALDAVAAAYAEVGLSVRYIMDGTSDAEIIKRFENLSGSVIGWNEFPSSNSCRKINGRLDTGYSPSDYRYWAGLECHETGHGVGLSHGRGSIMNPSILLVWPLTWVGTYSFANLKKWFGGVPLKPTDPPPPPPPGEPYNGVFTYDNKLLKIRVFE